MTYTRSSAVALLVLVPLLPVLQGAGCRAHYWAHLHGQVAVDGGAPGEQVQVIYRTRQPGTVPCTDDWTPCMSDSSWQPLGACETAATAKQAGGFDGCTGMVGVDYQADLAAFVDANGDGKLGPGERYGVYRDNPLTRDREAQLLPVEIRIDRTMPGAGPVPAPTEVPPPTPIPPDPPPAGDAADGEVCRSGARSGGGIERTCAAGLKCCYPCGIDGCDWKCMADCGPPRP